MRYLVIFPVVALHFFSSSVFSQTSEYGNLEVYSRETVFSAFGYFSGSFPLSEYVGGQRIDMNGLNYTNYYDISKISTMVPTNELEIRFLLKGAFKIGGAMGEKIIDNSLGLYPSEVVKYYMINIDFFTLSFQPEVTYIFKDGYALTLFMGLDILNVGGNIAFLEEGILAKHTVASINAAPLCFRPGLFFDFGRSAVGIVGQLNATNIFEYRVLGKELYPGKNGAKSFDAFVRKFEFQIIYTF
jgi:hypothetical protein